MSTKELQRKIIEFKKSKGFATGKESLAIQFCLMYGEVGEAFDTLYKRKPDETAFELADIGIYLLAIADILDIDLGLAIEEKMKINEGRTWNISEMGMDK